MNFFNKIGMIFIVLVTTMSCNSADMAKLKINTKYRDYSFGGIDLVHVNELPIGYLTQKEINKQYQDLFNIVFFESQVSILDLDGRNLMQTSISDNSFIVQYKDDIYFNSNKLLDILALAENTAEKERQIYNIGEPIETYNAFTEPVTVTIEKVSYANSYQDIKVSSNEWVCIVKMNIEDNADESVKEFLNGYSNNWEYFDHAETTDGQKYTQVFQNDSDEMVFSLPYGQKAEYLIIKSPSSWPSLRKIDINSNC